MTCSLAKRRTCFGPFLGTKRNSVKALAVGICSRDSWARERLPHRYWHGRIALYFRVSDMYPYMGVYPLHALEPCFSWRRRTCRWYCLAALAVAIDLRVSAMSVRFTWPCRHAAAGPERLRRRLTTHFHCAGTAGNQRRPPAFRWHPRASVWLTWLTWLTRASILFLFRREHNNRGDGTFFPRRENYTVWCPP